MFNATFRKITGIISKTSSSSLELQNTEKVDNTEYKCWLRQTSTKAEVNYFGGIATSVYKCRCCTNLTAGQILLINNERYRVVRVANNGLHIDAILEGIT